MLDPISTGSSVSPSFVKPTRSAKQMVISVAPGSFPASSDDAAIAACRMRASCWTRSTYSSTGPIIGINSLDVSA